MLLLTPEETLLLLTCRAYLTDREDALVRTVVAKGPHWPYVLWRSENYGTLPILSYHCRRLGVLENIPGETRTYVERWCSLSESRSIEQFRQLGTIVEAFESEGIDYFLLKGLALSALYYPNPLIRPMQDLDLMIRPKDAVRAQKTMFRLGFQHGVYDSSSGRFVRMYRRVTPELLRRDHELPSMTKCSVVKSPLPGSAVPWAWRRKNIKCFIDKEQVLTVPVFVDLHVNLSTGLALADVWRAVSREVVFGKKVCVHSATGLLWFVAARLYHEAFQFNTLKLLMLGDVHAILHIRGKDVDWAELLTVAHKYGMRPSLFYVLKQVRQLTGVGVPEAVLNQLRPSPLEIPMAHDWGDVLPKLLSRPALHEVRLTSA